MEDLELKKIWQAYDVKLERLLTLNLQNLEKIQAQKAQSKISSFIRTQITGIVVGMLFVAFLGFLIYHVPNVFFSVSVGMILLFTAYGTFVYFKHVVLLAQIDVDDSITDTQQRLASVQASSLQAGRILMLQTPFYTTWFYNTDMLQEGNWLLLIGPPLLFTALTIWLYRSLSLRNAHKKWVRVFLDSFGGKEISQAQAFLQEIETFKQENGVVS